MKSAVCCAGHGHPALIRSDGPDRPVTVLIPGVSNNPDLLVNLNYGFFLLVRWIRIPAATGLFSPKRQPLPHFNRAGFIAST